MSIWVKFAGPWELLQKCNNLFIRHYVFFTRLLLPRRSKSSFQCMCGALGQHNMCTHSLSCAFELCAAQSHQSSARCRTCDLVVLELFWDLSATTLQKTSSLSGTSAKNSKPPTQTLCTEDQTWETEPYGRKWAQVYQFSFEFANEGFLPAGCGKIWNQRPCR